MRPFKGKSILITGAGRGIGKRLAIGFASAGAHVGLLARSKAELDLAHLEIEHAGGSSLRLKCDVRDYAHVQAAADRMVHHFGSVQILICAHSSFGAIGPLAGAPPDKWAEAVQTNLTGSMNACRAVLPGMVANRWGKIVLLTGPGADGPRPNFTAYSATQAALVRFVESVAEEVSDSNIQINCMNPGLTYTSLTDEILAAGHLAGAREIEEAALTRSNGGTPPDRQLLLSQFLCSERSNHISGKLISVADDWKRLEHLNSHSALYTLRRLQKV
ncbi:MAG: SDR family oxidoreductase [Acidobacteria bacterium]|nr:SDR family oxidoreductase [Acidobacteriota bacterium]